VDCLFVVREQRQMPGPAKGPGKLSAERRKHRRPNNIA
jgi:hypothetical protein